MSYNKIHSHETDLLGDDFIQPDESPFVEASIDEPQTSRSQQARTTTNVNLPAQSHMFHISFYRQFFDLNSDEFFDKIKKSLNPLARIGLDPSTHTNELYGFVWITGTLIFLMFLSSTSSQLINDWLNGNKDKKFEYDFNLLNKSILLFYGYNIVIPLIYILLTSWLYKFPENMSLVQIISIYGYTNILWIPITIINLIIINVNESFGVLVNLIKWGIVLTGGLFTGLSNINKLLPSITKNCSLVQDQNKSKYYTIVAFLVISHLTFTILIKISFFGLN